MRRLQLDTAVLAGFAQALLPGGRAKIDMKLEEERAAMTLLALAGDRTDDMLAIAHERADRFRVNWMGSPRRPPSMSPLAAGIRSVIDDVQQGRLL